MSPSSTTPRRTRQIFERVARHYDQLSQIVDEIGARLSAHLDAIRLEPSCILDIGAGTGTATTGLARRYRRARIHALDCAHPMLLLAREKAPRWFSRQQFVCAGAESLPIRTNCAQLVYSNLMLPWCPDPDAVFREFARALAPGGLLLFSAVGPDTFQELRSCLHPHDPARVPCGLLDLHDLGDALVRCGLGDVVMEAERLTVQYPDVDAILRDLKGNGAVGSARAHGPGLGGRERYEALRRSYERLRRAGDLPLTCEVVYAHAWKPSISAPSASIPVAPPQAR